MLHFTCLAVHKVGGANDVAAKGGADGLMAETDAENRDFSCEVFDDVDADARLVRRAGTGRDDDAFRGELLDLFQCGPVVAAHHDFMPHFPDVLHQVVGKRIVVVQDKDHGSYPALSTARSSALALFMHSWYSLSGSESATMPAPACT